MPLSPQTIVSAGRSQVSCDLHDESVILQMVSGTYFSLNGVGARVWALIQSPIRLADLQATLLTEYDVEAPRLERDVVSLIDALVDAELIDVASPL